MLLKGKKKDASKGLVCSSLFNKAYREKWNISCDAAQRMANDPSLFCPAHINPLPLRKSLTLFFHAHY